MCAMPFDPIASPTRAAPVHRDRRLVAAWLFALCAMTLVMVALGGATRLTGSGLSIMEWAPLSGVLPPLGQREWERLYGLYQRIPQYKLVNTDIGLDGFKHIFWLEWVHRLWGRLLGVVFIVPLLALWWRGAISRGLRWRLLGLFALGGLQGAVGWFMVASGFFPDSTAVSPYRLVVHLSLALTLYAAMLWTGLSVLRPLRRRASPLGAWLAVLAGMVALTIVAGGFTAGLHAGLIYNTYPLMGGHLVPGDYLQLTPALRNLTENVAAVQFDHRLLATATALLALLVAAVGWRMAPRADRALRRGLLLLGLAVAVQYALGVATLLWMVPVSLATAHQANAVLLLTTTLCCLHFARRASVQ